LKGFAADHAEISLLRLRNYTIGRKLTNEEVLGPEGLARVADLFSTMHPFVSEPRNLHLTLTPLCLQLPAIGVFTRAEQSLLVAVCMRYARLIGLRLVTVAALCYVCVQDD